jgi:rhodanese-related sulfurtransferase
MMKFSLALICYFALSTINTSQAQLDGLSPGRAVDAAALSPDELPTFDEYKADPENIKVKSISSKDLVEIITDGTEKIVILDTRTRAEYNISRLKKARRMGYNDFMIERVWMINRQSRVILYSTTGKRALVVAQYLILMGFRDLHILDGSLIGWVNEGRDLYDAEKLKTTKVHVGEKKNMTLLKVGEGVHY